jgi:UPF0716 protein FxsA
MLPSLRLAFGLIFIAFPLLEIALLIKSGELIGFWPTVLILAGSAFLGMAVIRTQGISMVSRMVAAVNEGRLSLEPLVDGYAKVLAGILLILPGLLSDAIGLILLVPPLRRLAIRWTFSSMVKPARPPGSASQSPKMARPTVIEGTYERLDEHDVKKNNDP